VGEGLPVAESGRLIGLSGQELDPVVGPGQVAPGMDQATFERLRRWGTTGRQPPTARPGTPTTRRAARAAAGRAKAAEAEARREQSRQQRSARAQARQAARADAARVRAARAESRASAREQSRQARATRARQRQTARDESRQAKATQAAERAAAQEEARQAKATEAAARAAARKEEEAAQAAKRAAAQEEARLAKAAEAAERAAAQEVARQAGAAQAAERAAAREQARRAKAAEAAERAAARKELRRAKAAQAAERRAVRARARQVRAAEGAERRAALAETRRANVAQAKARRAERAEARRVGRAEARRVRAARIEVRRAARADAGQARAVRRQEAGQARAVRRQGGRQVRAAKAEVNRAARSRARQERAVRAEARREQSRQARATRAQARQAAREEAGRARAVQAEQLKAARDHARQLAAATAEERRVAREQARQAEAARAEERRVAREQARQAEAAEAEVRREESRRVAAAMAEARGAARAEAGRQRAARAEERAVARDQARRASAERAEARRAKAAEARRALVGAARGWVGGVAGVGLLVVVMAAGVAAAGWRGAGGPDTLAGEVAVVRAAGGSGGGLVAQDPRMGPIEPLHALAVGAWLRATEAGTSLEGAVRDARVPGRFLLAGAVAMTMLLFLMLMRVGPGTGAAAGPGPAPPQPPGRGRWRLAGAALAGALVALDPLLVRGGRAATGTILAVALALVALALAWGLPPRPGLRRLPLVAAAGGLALLVSPLALPVLAVPVVAELLEGRYREAWRDTAAAAAGIGLWLVLPVWVAGQDLGSGQAGWLLGRPPGRGSVAASLAGAPLSWLLVVAGLTAAVLTWRHRSGARPDAGPGAARPLAWVATTAAGALVAVALGYPAGQALVFAAPAAAVSLALAGTHLAATTGRTRRLALTGVGVALAGLLVAQGIDWDGRYGGRADDGLSRLVVTVAAQVPRCSAVNASGPDDRARLLAAGATVTEFSDGPAAQAAGVRYFVLTGATDEGGPMTPSLAAWVRQHGNRLAADPSPSLDRVELWHVDAAPLDPLADSLPVPDGVFSNVDGSACGGYRVVDSQAGAFATAYRAVGGKAVLGRPLGSVWTSDGPALQAFDTMVLGAVPSTGGPPAVRPIELPPLLVKLDVQAVAKADIPLPSTRPPVTDRQARALLGDKLIARVYLGTDPATATPEDYRRARDRFGRPLGMPQTMPDGAVRQPFERVVLELPADGGPARPAALGRLAVRLGLVPKQAMRLEPVPGLPPRPAEARLDTGPLLRPLGALLALLLLAAGAGAVAARRPGTAADRAAAEGR
jgi:hypothetical protein